MMNFAQLGMMMGADSGITPMSFSGITEFIYTGDSIAVGSNATAGNSYAELLTAQYSGSYAAATQNVAVGARGVWNEAESIALIGFTRSSTAFFIEAGLNDLRRNSTIKCYNKIESCLMQHIRRAWLDNSTIVSGGDASITRVGTFNGFNARQFGGVYSGFAAPPSATSGCFNTTANATFTKSFTGDNVFIQFNATDGVAVRGSCEIRIDSVLVDTITDFNSRYDGTSDGAYDNARGPDCRIYTGLSSGAHSLEIKSLSTSAVVVDQIGVLLPPASCGVIFVIEIPKVTDYSKPGLDQANDSVIDAANTIRENIVNRFFALGYRIKFIRINKANGGLYDLVNVDTDGVHPTNAGHLQIFNSIKRHII